MQSNLGQQPDAMARRDAVHVAIMPALAEMDLEPGQPVEMIDSIRAVGDLTQFYGGITHRKFSPHGVVDPFLKEKVKAGERFWLCLYPNTTTPVRHDWKHLQLDADVQESEYWLMMFANKWQFNYEEMIDAVMGARGGKDCYIVAHGFDLHSKDELGEEDYKLFWHHMEIVTGLPIPEDAKEKLTWTCSC